MRKRAASSDRPAPCFEILVNGKRLAVAGIRGGEGNLNAHVSWSRSRHYAEGWASRGGIRLHVGGGDFNDPKWDRFVRWVDRRIRVGDRIEIRVADNAAPDRGFERTRARRIPVEEYPSSRNPTALELPGVSVYALTNDVLLSVGKRWMGTAQLSPREAKKVARGLLKAAEAAQSRRRSRE